MALLRFAYAPGIGVDDTVIYFLLRSLSHQEKPGNTIRIVFFYFFSAFNTKINASEGQIGAPRGGPPPHSMDHGLPPQMTIVCEDMGL